MRHYKVILSVILTFLLIFSQTTTIFAAILGVSAAVVETTDDSTTVKATVTSDVYTDLQDGAASVSYSVYRDGDYIEYGGSVSSLEGIESVGDGVYSRDYEFTVDKDDYSLNGDYSAVVNAVYGGDSKSDEVDIFGIDGYDDSSSYNTATRIYENIEYNKAIDFAGDKDYFKFIPALSGGYCIETFGSTNTTGQLTEAYKSNWGYWISNTLSIDYNSGNSNNFKIQYQLEAGKEYYIRVYNSSYYSTGDYTLKITRIQNDHGDGYDTATEIFEDQEVQGNIQFVKNQDYFCFTPEQDTAYSIRQLSGINCNVYLYDNNGNWQNWGDGSKNNFEIIHNLKSGQIYNIVIKAANSSNTGTYSFKIQKLTKIKGIISLPSDAPANEARGIRVFADNGNYISSTYAYNYPYSNNYLNIDEGENSVAYAVYVPEETGFTVKLTTWDNRYEGELYYGLDGEVQSEDDAAQIDTSFGEVENINIELKSKKCISGNITLPKYMEIEIVASNGNNTSETWVANYEGKDTVSYSVYVSKDEGYTIKYVLPEWSSWKNEYLTDYYYSNNGMVKDLELATRLDMRENHIENINLQLVSVVKVTGVEIDKEKIDVPLGRNENLLAQVIPSNASYPEIKWTSSNSYIASVDSNGKVTGNSLGTTKVRAWSVSNQVYFADCEVNVIPVSVTGVEIDKNELIIEETTTKQLTASILPVDATNQEVVWTSNDDNIATVSQKGLITAVSKGTTTVRASSVADSVYEEVYYDECLITVIELQPRSISGTISLPDGELAPEGGLNLSVSASVYADEPGTAVQVVIPEGNNSVEYVINDLLPQKNYYVYYNIDSGKGYNPKGYYGLNKTQVNSSSSDQISLDSNAENINITLIKDDHGNDFSTATIIQENVEMKSNIDYAGDKDYFQFIPESDGVYVVKTKDSNTDMYGYLYDGNQNSIASDDDSAEGANFLIAYEMKAGESYYIIAERLGNHSTGYYTILINRVEDDYGNSFENASNIELEKEYTGEINYSKDNDYFSFIPETNGYYYISKTSGYKCYAYLYDENQNYLNYGYGFDIKYQLEAGKKYYLKVYYYYERDYGFKIEKMNSVRGNISVSNDTSLIDNIYVYIENSNNSNYNDQCTVTIPKGQNSVSYSVYVPDGEDYKIHYYISDYEFVPEGYYSENGTVRDSNEASNLDIYEDISDINLVLEPKKEITGTISLPDEEKASSSINGINIYVTNGIYDGSSYYSNGNKYITIPQGQNSVSYSVYVPEDSDYVVEYTIGSSYGYESNCYYSQNGTVSFENQADKIDVGEYGVEGINLTLLPQRQISGILSLPEGLDIDDDICVDIYLESTNVSDNIHKHFYEGGATSIPFTFQVKIDSDYKLSYSLSHDILETNMYYSDSGAVKDESDAELLDVTNGNIDNIEFVIPYKKSISGTVSLPNEETADSDIKNIKVEIKNSSYKTYYQYVDILEGQDSVAYAVYLPECEDYTVKYYVSSSYSYESGYYYSDTGMVQDKENAAKFDIDGQDIENINLELVKRVYLEEIVLNESEITLLVGNEQQLAATILPEYATRKDIYWSSDDTSIAMVSSSGIVTALKAGTTRIKAVSEYDSDIYAECTVNVTENSVKLNTANINMEIGEIKSFTAQAKLNGEEYTDILWSSSNESVATVTQDGEVEAIAEGTATIRAACKDSSDIYAECVVNVYENLVTIDEVEWQVNEELRSYFLNSIAYGNDIFVAVGDNGVIRTSEDGKTWKNQDSGVSVDFNKVIWNGSQFVAIGESAAIVVSDNGIDWTVVSSIKRTYKELIDIVWNGSKYVAVGEHGIILTSDDGIQWDLGDLNYSVDSNTITWNGEYFIISAYNMIFKSLNGIEWEEYFINYRLEFTNITWDGDKFIGTDDDEIYVSSDGVNWSLVLDLNSYSDFSRLYCDGNKCYALIGTEIYISTNGEEWDKIESDANYYLKDMTAGRDVIVGIGYSGQIYLTQNYIQWQQTEKNGFDFDIEDVVCNGNKFVAITEDEKILSSEDGVNWTEIPLEGARELQAITYGKGKFVVIDKYKGSYISYDGENWSSTYKDTNTDEDTDYDKRYYVDSMTCNGEVFVACGDEGSIFVSEDGKNWLEEPIYDSDWDDIELYSVIWDGNRFIACGYGVLREDYEWTENGVVLTSVDGFDWTILGPQGIFGISKIASNGSKYVIDAWAITEGDEGYAEFGRKILYSSDLINWYENNGENINLNKIVWDGRNFVGIESGFLYYSEDACQWQSEYIGNNLELSGIAWNGEKYVLVGEQGSIVVSFVPVEKIELSKSELSIEEGKTEQLEATITPDNAENKTLIWTTSDKNVVTVSDTGLVTAVSEGTAAITATSESNPEVMAVCTITVTSETEETIEVEKVELNKGTTIIEAGKTEQLEAIITPDNAENKSLVWTSSNENVATVSDAGLVTAVSEGTAIITVTSESNLEAAAVCTVTVTSKPEETIEVEKVELNKGTTSIKEGKTEQLEATIIPDNAENKSLIWATSNKNVATVSDTGLVTAVSVGKATIKAASAENQEIYDQCTVTVTAKKTSSGGTSSGGGSSGGGSAGNANNEQTASDNGHSTDAGKKAEEQGEKIKKLLGNGANKENISQIKDAVKELAALKPTDENGAVEVIDSAAGAANEFVNIMEEDVSVQKDLTEQTSELIKSVVANIKQIQTEVKAVEAVDKVSSMLESATKMIQLVESDELREIMLEEVGSAVKSLSGVIDIIDTESQVIGCVDKVIEKTAGIVGTAQTAQAKQKEENTILHLQSIIEKAVSKLGQSTFDIEKTGEASIVNIDNDTANLLLDKIDTVVETAAQYEDKLKEKNIDIEVEKKITIKANTSTGSKYVEVQLPTNVLDIAREKGLNKIELDTGNSIISIPSGAVDTENSGSMSLAAEVVDNNELDESIRETVGNSKVYDFNLDVVKKSGETEKISEFNSSIEIKLPYDISYGEDPEKITVFYINNNGELINQIGVYDAETKTVKFNTNHFSKYMVKENKITFTDIENVSWAKTQIEIMASKGIVNGFGEGVFNPNDNITRAQFAAIIVNALNISNEDAKCDFEDVREGDWYYNAVAAAVDQGLIKESSDGTFRPNDNITRQDMAVIISRAIKKYKKVFNSGDNVSELEFSDGDEISDYALNSVAFVEKYNIIKGVSNNKFAPKDLATRAQAAVIIYRFFNIK